MRSSAKHPGYEPAIEWPDVAWAMPEISTAGGLTAHAIEVVVRPIDPSQSEGIGSALAIRSDPLQIFWSRPYGRSWVHCPWARYDLRSGNVTTSRQGSGLHGDLVDWLPGDDGQALFLLTHSIAVVDLVNMRPSRTLSRGFPKWSSKLLSLGRGLVGATGWTGETMTVVDTSTLAVRKTVRIHSPDAVWFPRGDQQLELLSFNGQTGRLIDLDDLSLGRARRLPKGKWPIALGDRAWIVRGSDIEEPRAPRIRGIRGERIAEVHLPTGEIVRQGPTLDAPERVLGIDRRGRVLVRCRNGFVLLDQLTLEPVLTVRQQWGTFGAVSLLPDGASAAALANIAGPERLLLFEWAD